MRVLGSRQFAMFTRGMSLPLLFSVRLKTPPAFFQGLPFVLSWTRAVVSAITVPLLTGLEIIACVYQLRRRDQSEAKAALPFHATALVVAIVAEIVFIAARRSGASWRRTNRWRREFRRSRGLNSLTVVGGGGHHTP